MSRHHLVGNDDKGRAVFSDDIVCNPLSIFKVQNLTPKGRLFQQGVRVAIETMNEKFLDTVH